MSSANLTPHPLVRCVPKEMETFLTDQKKEPETITEYIKHSPNPRLSASHLVRAIADGLYEAKLNNTNYEKQLSNRTDTFYSKLFNRFLVYVAQLFMLLSWKLFNAFSNNEVAKLYSLANELGHTKKYNEKYYDNFKW